MQHGRKGKSNSPQDFLEKGFIKEMRGLPEEFVRDIFVWYSSREMKEADLELKLVQIAELFRCDYDDRADPLDGSDWEFIRDTVNEYAHELDEEVLTYVLGKVVEKGAIGGS